MKKFRGKERRKSSGCVSDEDLEQFFQFASDTVQLVKGSRHISVDFNAQRQILLQGALWQAPQQGFFRSN